MEQINSQHAVLAAINEINQHCSDLVATLQGRPTESHSAASLFDAPDDQEHFVVINIDKVEDAVDLLVTRTKAIAKRLKRDRRKLP